MSKLENKHSNSLQFTEYDFIRLLLVLLRQYGVYRVNDKELQKKLFYYYKNPYFKKLFEEINITAIENQKIVDLHRGIQKEKMLREIIWMDLIHANTLNLRDTSEINLEQYKQLLSNDANSKIQQIAQELGIIREIERSSIHKLNIYKTNPNQQYQLIHEENKKNYAFEFILITDGNIAIPDNLEQISHQYMPNKAIQLKDPKTIDIHLKNASYVIIQTLNNYQIQYCSVYTEILENEKLRKIVDIANMQHKNQNDSIKKELPYVKKITLK